MACSDLLCSVLPNERTKPGSPFEAVCDGCETLTQCLNCSFEEPLLEPTCTAELGHTNSSGGDTTIETLSVEPGHWRATAVSENVFGCYNADACLGGLTGTAGYCREGYEGPCMYSSQHIVRMCVDDHPRLHFVVRRWLTRGRAVTKRSCDCYKLSLLVATTAAGSRPFRVFARHRRSAVLFDVRLSVRPTFVRCGVRACASRRNNGSIFNDHHQDATTDCT